MTPALCVHRLQCVSRLVCAPPSVCTAKRGGGGCGLNRTFGQSQVRPDFRRADQPAKGPPSCKSAKPIGTPNPSQVKSARPQLAEQHTTAIGWRAPKNGWAAGFRINSNRFAYMLSMNETSEAGECLCRLQHQCPAAGQNSNEQPHRPSAARHQTIRVAAGGDVVMPTHEQTIASNHPFPNRSQMQVPFQKTGDAEYTWQLPALRPAPRLRTQQ